jgi:hypothetical protein
MAMDSPAKGSGSPVSMTQAEQAPSAVSMARTRKNIPGANDSFDHPNGD